MVENGPRYNKLGDLEREALKQEAIEALETAGTLHSIEGLNPEGIEIVSTNWSGFNILMNQIKKSPNPDYLFIPSGIPNVRGSSALGPTKYVSNRGGTITEMDLEGVKKLIDKGVISKNDTFVVAFPKEGGLSRYVSHQREKQEKTATTEDRIRDAVDELNGAVENYHENLRGEVNSLGLIQAALTLDDLASLPGGIIDPSKLGGDEVLNPMAYLMEKFRTDREVVFETTEKLRRAWNRLRGASIRLSQKDANQAVITEMYTMNDRYALKEEFPEDKRFAFTLEDSLKEGFAILNLNLGLGIQSEKSDEAKQFPNHPVTSAAIYRLISNKKEFKSLVDHKYRDVILRHHAGLGSRSIYPVPVKFETKNLPMSPNELPEMSPEDALAVPIMLAFAYDTFYSSMRRMPLKEETQDDFNRRAEEAGWISPDAAVRFRTMTWLKSQMKHGATEPVLLERMARTLGVPAAGSHVAPYQKDADRRFKSKAEYHESTCEMNEDGTINMLYDREGNPIYGKTFDTRGPEGQQTKFDILRI